MMTRSINDLHDECLEINTRRQADSMIRGTRRPSGFAPIKSEPGVASLADIFPESDTCSEHSDSSLDDTDDDELYATSTVKMEREPPERFEAATHTRKPRVLLHDGSGHPNTRLSIIGGLPTPVLSPESRHSIRQPEPPTPRRGRTAPLVSKAAVLDSTDAKLQSPVSPRMEVGSGQPCTTTKFAKRKRSEAKSTQHFSHASAEQGSKKKPRNSNQDVASWTARKRKVMDMSKKRRKQEMARNKAPKSAWLTTRSRGIGGQRKDNEQEESGSLEGFPTKRVWAQLSGVHSRNLRKGESTG